MYRVLNYSARCSFNLGDATQTYALCRLLGTQTYAINRDDPVPSGHDHLPLIVNGWLGHAGAMDTTDFPWLRPWCFQGDCTFAGIHLGRRESHHIEWIRRTGALVGCRDPYTQGLLRSTGVPSETIGCATLTLPRYSGPRSGRFTIDVRERPGMTALTNTISDMTWEDQWKRCVERLDLLRRAEVVYTNRLHVILPCLAFGTPVLLPSGALSPAFGKARLTILWELGFQLDREMVLDISSWAERYKKFLADRLGHPLSPCDDPPIPIEDEVHAGVLPSFQAAGTFETVGQRG